MKFKRLLIYSLVFLVVSDALLYIGLVGDSNEYMTPLSFVAKFVVLFNLIYFARKSNWEDELTNTVSVLLKLELVWNIIAIIRGVITAHGYWEWKFLFLNSGFFFLVPLAFFVGKSPSLARASILFVLKYLFVFGFLAIPIALATNYQLYSRLMIPVSFFLVMIPYLKSRDKFLVIAVAVTSVWIAIDFRAGLIKIAISTLILSIWYVRRYISITWIKLLHIILFLAPFPLLYLAASGQYNIFKAVSENKGYTVKANKFDYGEEESMTADTRTFLYVEVFKTLNEKNEWLFGEGAVGKYKTQSFDYLVTKNERFASEVGFLNLLLYSGILGVIFYALLLFIVSHNAIYYSNNWLSKMLGLVIISRWLLFFLEEFTQLDLNFYFLWVIIGMVSSRPFRGMTDDQVFIYLTNFKRNTVNIVKSLRLSA